MQNSKENIVHYYEHCETDYSLFWDLDRSRALHAGYWDETTRNLTDALRRENEVLAEMAKINATDTVLDAGCGIGGSSLFLSKNFNCDVVGISLSPKQIEKAETFARNENYAKPPRFYTMDFNKTTFPNETFSVIWGIESVCHAADKSIFIEEAYRLLKPGGRLIIADGFALKGKYDPQQHRQMSYWLNGWGVDTLDTMGAFRQSLEKSGFQHISYTDATPNVMPSSKRLYWIFFPGLIYSKVGQWLGLRTQRQTENIWGAYYQYKTLKNDLWQYGIFYAEKPHSSDSVANI